MGQLQRPKFFKSVKLIICFTLFIFSLQSFSQSENEDPIDQDIQELEKNLDSFKQNQEQMAKMLENFSEEDKKKLNDAIKSGDKEAIQNVVLKIAKNTDGSHLQQNLSASLSHFRNFSEQELKDQFLKNSKGTLLEPILINAPFILNILVKVLRDPIALPQLFTIIKDRTKLIIFAITNIFLFFFSWAIKKKQKAKNMGFFHGIIQWFSRTFIMTTIRFTVFLLFFYKEAWPLIKLISQNIF